MGNPPRSDFPSHVFGFADALGMSQGTRWNASLPTQFVNCSVIFPIIHILNEIFAQRIFANVELLL